jgi:GAF domain-containing protein
MTDPEPDFPALLEEVRETAAKEGPAQEKLERICHLLHERVPRYDWVGFYLAQGGRELVLGPFRGEPTEHTRIPFGTGVCGQAAERRETLVVPDVRREGNYLSCSASVRSEIVIPVLEGGRVVAELDIDSHVLNAFTPADALFLEEVCRSVEGLIAFDRIPDRPGGEEA